MKKISGLHIEDFRCFKDVTFKLGKRITAIAGHNATGKSTILGLIGHCAELKMKDGVPILQKQFRTEFSEIIKASTEFDKRTSLTHTIYFLSKEEISFRTTWQKDSRFRIIPKKTKTRNTERKIEWPTLYLGLSRLYPIGESEQARTSKISLTDAQKETFFLNYKRILSLNEEPIDCSAITIKETTKKTVGIRTDRYDPITNSAGQDNLSQILFAVMSFSMLRNQMGNRWSGGLLLIDELDATLHPSAQEKLVAYLYKAAEELEVQIVFTTHSLSMLRFICEKCEYNSDEQENNYELIYLTTRNQYLEVIANPEYDVVYCDLLNTLSILPSEYKKITVYTEDDEARWFLKKLVGEHVARINLPNIHLGHDQLLKLLQEDFKHFNNTLFVLDGDVDQRKVDEACRHKKIPNVVKLPGDKSPEELIFEFLENTDGGHELYKQLAESATGFSKRTLAEKGPESMTQFTKSRDKFKEWFKQVFHLIDQQIYSYWENENREVADLFRDKFVVAFNDIAKRIGAPKIAQ